MTNKIFRSPLFYVGDKYKLIQEIRSYFPNNIRKFIEPFAGGGSVFMNIEAESYYLNDIDYYVFGLHNYLISQSHNPELFFKQVYTTISRYGLSSSYICDIVPMELKKKWSKTYYAKFNKLAFNQLKQDYNKSDKSNFLHLYILLIYGFNRMIRFNSLGNYNLPVGNVDFNKNVADALNNYFAIVQNRSIQWYNMDYKHFINSLNIDCHDFLYFDPPYLITFSEYNKLWNEDKEKDFIAFLNTLDSEKVKFAVSNVTHYKEKQNNIFNRWAQNFNIIPVQSNYISYHDNTKKEFKEVLVTNYVK
jgi:DNA adenine methylase